MTQSTPFPEEYYQGAPMTSRSGFVIARWSRFLNLGRMAKGIPLEAEVADIGAGFSSLGKEICELRPDINWTNVDLNYSDSGMYSNIFQSVQESSPPNLQYVQANALELVDTFGTQQFDLVNSFWMIQYLILAGKEGSQHDGKDTGHVAVENMLRIAKLSGKVAIGPHFRPVWNFGQIKRVSPAENDDELSEQARKIVKTTALPYWLNESVKLTHKI